MTAAVWYATLEQVKAATDTKETARNNAQIARAIAAATDSVEDQLCRRFYPEIGSWAFNWPGHADPVDGSRTFSLGRHELVACTEIRVNGVVVDPAAYTLLPVDFDGGPYTGVEFDSTVTLPDGVSERRVIEVDGTAAYWNRETPAATLAAAIVSTAAPTVDVSDSGGIGVGHLLLVGAERMIVDRKSMLDTGTVTLDDLTASNNAEQLPVGNGALFAEGEVILVDAEKMLVVEIAGDTLVVKRAWDGSTIAAHTTGAQVFAARRLTVRRGLLGTTAATHTQGTAVTTHAIPALVNELCIAEALVTVAQQNSAYGRTVGSGESERPAAGAGIEDIRVRARKAFGRWS